MLELYRGLVDILTARCEGLNAAFSKHIRAFNNGANDENSFGVNGFWNLLLEIVFVMYVKMFAALGVILTVALALLFFPLHAMRIAVINIINHRAEPFVIDEPNEPINKEIKDGNSKKEK